MIAVYGIAIKIACRHIGGSFTAIGLGAPLLKLSARGSLCVNRGFVISGNSGVFEQIGVCGNGNGLIRHRVILGRGLCGYDIEVDVIILNFPSIIEHNIGVFYRMCFEEFLSNGDREFDKRYACHIFCSLQVTDIRIP